MTCREWTILLIGAAIGATIGLFLTILYTWINKMHKEIKLRKYFTP